MDESGTDRAPSSEWRAFLQGLFQGVGGVRPYESSLHDRPRHVRGPEADASPGRSRGAPAGDAPAPRAGRASEEEPVVEVILVPQRMVRPKADVTDAPSAPAPPASFDSPALEAAASLADLGEDAEWDAALSDVRDLAARHGMEARVRLSAKDDPIRTELK